MFELRRPFHQISKASRLAMVLIVTHISFAAYLLLSSIVMGSEVAILEPTIATTYAIVSPFALFICVAPILSVDYKMNIFGHSFKHPLQKIKKSTVFIMLFWFVILELVTYIVCSLNSFAATFALGIASVIGCILIIFALLNEQWEEKYEHF